MGGFNLLKLVFIQIRTPALLAAAAHHLWPCRRTERATESGDSAFSGYRGGCLIRKAP